MLFTVGRDKIYRARMEVWGPQKKTGQLDSPYEGYKGGCVFQTIEDAHQYIKNYCQGEEDKFAVFGLADTEWSTDTIPSDDMWWHHLLWSRPIVLLDKVSDKNVTSVDQ